MPGSEHLRHAIHTAGLTVEEFADLIGVNPKTVGRWVTGTHAPQRHNQIRIARALKLPVEDLWPNPDPDPASTDNRPGTARTDGRPAVNEVTGTWGHANRPTAPDPIAFLATAEDPIDLLTYSPDWTAEALRTHAEQGRTVRVLLADPRIPAPAELEHPHIQVRASTDPARYELIRAGERMLLALRPQPDPEPILLELTRHTPDGIFDRITHGYQTLWDNATEAILQSQPFRPDASQSHQGDLGRNPSGNRGLSPAHPGTAPGRSTHGIRSKGRQPTSGGRPRLWPQRPK